MDLDNCDFFSVCVYVNITNLYLKYEPLYLPITKMNVSIIK